MVPDQNSPDNFEKIKAAFPNALGKMIFNGPDAHPLAKYIRKNSNKIYDFEMFGANKTIPLNIFHLKGEKVNYYPQSHLE